MDDVDWEEYRAHRLHLHDTFSNISVDEYVEQRRRELQETGGIESARWFLDTWDTFDDALDILYDEHTARYGSLVRDTVESYEGKTILDLACGTQTTFPYLASDRNTVIQLDVARDSLKYLSYKLPPDTETHIIHGTAFDLPIADDSIDVIIAEAGFGAFNEPDLPSWGRTLKADGDVLHLFTAHAPHLSSVHDALSETGLTTFAEYFEQTQYREGEGSILFTGYYEPENI